MKPGSPSIMRPSLIVSLKFCDMELSMVVALGSSMRREISTVAYDAPSLRPPAWTIRSSRVRLWANAYWPGVLISPSMVMSPMGLMSSLEATTNTSFFFSVMSGAVPLSKFSRLTGMISIVLSSVSRKSWARLRNASSLTPWAILMRSRRVLSSELIA